MDNLDRCVGSCNTLNDFSKKVYEKQNIYNRNTSLNLIVENVTQIKSGVTISVGVSVKTLKKIMCEKKVKFGILLRVVVKMVNM